MIIYVGQVFFLKQEGARKADQLRVEGGPSVLLMGLI